jgi:ribosomal protein S18 acetylase RimI-like enzyme
MRIASAWQATSGEPLKTFQRRAAAVLFTYWEMRIGLDAAYTPATIPDIITIRSASRPDDVQIIARLYGEAFGDAPWPDDWTSFPGYHPAGVFVAEQAGKVVAFVVSYVRGRHGYISVAATAPDHRRRGIARALITAALRRFRDLGLHDVVIDVRADNVAAIRCYESVGFRKVGEFEADERCRAPKSEDVT